MKKRALLLRFLSHQSFEKFSPRLLFTSKMDDIKFSQFESSSSPNFWFFTLFRKPFKGIFFVKLSSKCHGNALELIKSSWFWTIFNSMWGTCRVLRNEKPTDYWPLVNFVRDLTSFLTEDTMRYLTSNFIENKMRNLILTSNFSSPHSSLAIVSGQVRIPQIKGAGEK